jgi:hypothetical protein
MTEVGLAEIFGMGEAIGIIATLFVILYFSRKQMETLSLDIETRFSVIWMKNYAKLPLWGLSDQN